MPHHLADGDLRLAVGAELRPVLGDGRVVVDQGSVDEPVDDRRGHALGRGEHHGARVGGPVRGAAAVGPARPDIDNGLAIQVDRQCAAAVPGSGEHLGERAHRAGEMRVGRALNTVWERCAAFPAVNVLHNASNLPGTPANKPAVTDPLIHRMSALSRRRRTAIWRLGRRRGVRISLPRRGSAGRPALASAHHRGPGAPPRRGSCGRRDCRTPDPAPCRGPSTRSSPPAEPCGGLRTPPHR